jgi:hypothetical protein
MRDDRRRRLQNGLPTLSAGHPFVGGGHISPRGVHCFVSEHSLTKDFAESGHACQSPKSIGRVSPPEAAACCSGRSPTQHQGRSASLAPTLAARLASPDEIGRFRGSCIWPIGQKVPSLSVRRSGGSFSAIWRVGLEHGTSGCPRESNGLLGDQLARLPRSLFQT